MSERFSPYIKPQSINIGLVASSKLGGSLYPDSFDKRAGTSVIQKTTKIVDTAVGIADFIENAIGIRSPMYKIGEISNDLVSKVLGVGDSILKHNSLYNSVTGLIRGVSEQEGVIIDGIGDVQGDFSVELTTNPAYYKSSYVTDHRYRNPTRLKQIVLVSNYLDDNIVASFASGISALDPTGVLGIGKNILCHNGNTRSQNALYKLIRLMENAKPFRVYTPHGIYDNMLIKSIHPLTDDKKMDMLYCEIQYQEIIFYQPYTNTPGKVPARIGIGENKQPEDWSQKTVNTAKDWLQFWKKK